MSPIGFKAVVGLLMLFALGPTPKRAIRGVVVDANGRGVSESEVYAIPENAMDKPPFKVTADTTGRFTLSGLPDNTYYLDASKEDEGYIFSLFSFYVMPGEIKPKVRIVDGKVLDEVLIKLGAKVAYLEIDCPPLDDTQDPVNLEFVRPDLPGYYRRNFITGELIPVPSVPFYLNATQGKERHWSFSDATNSNLIKPRPGDHVKVNIVWPNRIVKASPK